MKRKRSLAKRENTIEAYISYANCTCDDAAYTHCLYNTFAMILMNGNTKHTANNYHK